MASIHKWDKNRAGLESESWYAKNLFTSNLKNNIPDEVPNENGVYEGVVGAVVNGTAVATIDDFGYTPDKVKMLRYTVPQVNFGQVLKRDLF